MSNWLTDMAAVQSRAILESCNVTDLIFTSGHQIEVRLALSTLQKKQGLSGLDSVDMGMLFYYEYPTYVPFTMTETNVTLDIAHYDIHGRLIQKQVAEALSSAPITCSQPFTYVLEMPMGTLPSGNFRLADG